MSIRTWIEKAAWAANRRFGGIVPYPVRRYVYHHLLYRGSRKALVMCVDVVGTCNLRCPSCPVGNMPKLNASGLMDVELFARIVEKADRDFGVHAIFLHNWAEPLLHPCLPELIRIVKDRGLFCGISSNLNLLRDPDAILRAAPNDLRISLSGFTQEVYGQTHAQGNVERVKANMRALSEAKTRVRNRVTRIHVYYHKYRHNLHEVAPMHQLATELGFDWLEHWAYYMPLERLLDLVEDRLPTEQRDFVERQYALPIREAVDAARQFRDERCVVLEDQIVLDVRGNVNLCCAVYEFEKNRLGNFLSMTPADMARAKKGHPTCTRCTSHGLHVLGAYFDHPHLGPIFENLVQKNLARQPQPAAVNRGGPTRQISVYDSPRA
jgi:MoaA/NifB/PqqE/SkfB family radical SAM enzyme